jgi:asparagine synthase (glutamine-hydrolysing)
MCGISGIFAYNAEAAPVSSAELIATRDAMSQRGPDGSGLWISPDGRIGLAHRRLAILDLTPSAAQPMSSADGRWFITFNGEIYNFRALRVELESRGHHFRSSSDTEVLLYMYLEHGPDMVRRLRGMFALAIWDQANRELFLARDPFGIKPLYYSQSGGVFRFASQVKALLAGGAVSFDPDPAGHAGFFLWSCVPEPFTTYRAIKALPAGSTMLVNSNGATRPSQYFSVRERIIGAEEAGSNMSDADVRAAVSEMLRDSVRHHLVSDVPVGLFLSSGIDSSTLAALATEAGAEHLRAVTLGFRELRGTPDDETGLASRVAQAYGALHDVRWVEKTEFDTELSSILAAMDQPSTDGVNTYLVSRAAAHAGLKVAISGVGGDELFGGYASFRDVPRMERLPAIGARFPRSARWLRRAASLATQRWTSPKFAGIAEFSGTTAGAYLLRRALYMPWELDQVMDRDAARQGLEELCTLERLSADVRGIRSPKLRVSALELSWYMRNQLLRDADWAGMAHSLEIRVPLVDASLFEAILPCMVSRNPPSKRVLALAPRTALPEEITKRPKTGFRVPVAEWTHDRDRPRARGVRGWARHVNRSPGVGYRVLALMTDAYGGIGGIARFNRNLLAALSSHENVREIVVIPRAAPLPPEAMPLKVRFAADAVGSKKSYLQSLLRYLLAGPSFDLVLCGHIHLVPVACLAALIHDAPSVGILHGIEAWSAPGNLITRNLVSRINRFAAVSHVTMDRFRMWSGFDPAKLDYLPNAIVLKEFGPGVKNQDLLELYGLSGKRVLLTVARLEAAERYKGVDRVIEALPKLLGIHPDLAYLVVGDGTDRERLERLAEHLGVAHSVRFAGHVADDQKAEHFRLADVFVLPSKGEGFGIVLLEAMACGIPVVASKVDGSREAVGNGRMGILVDPDAQNEVISGILQALDSPLRRVPEQLREFDFPSFEYRSHRLVDALFHGRGEPGSIRSGSQATVA